jgi:hypothetical protein
MDNASLAVRDLRLVHYEQHSVAGISTAQVPHYFERAADR